MIKKAKSAISIRIFAMSLAVAGALMFMPVDTYAAVTEMTTNTDISFTAGELNLVKVPTISFGNKIEIFGTTHTYNAVAITENINVNDLRGSGVGWKLTATLSKFEDDNKKNTLEGAFLTVTSQEVSPVGDNTATAPTPNNSLKLIAGGASNTVLSATAGQGLGDWKSVLSNETTTLTVLGGTAIVGPHAATINWSLALAP